MEKNQTEMPMMFHKIYLVLLILFLINSMLSASMGTFIAVPIYIGLLYGLYNRKKWAPTLVKIYSIYSIVVSTVLIIMNFVLSYELNMVTESSGGMVIGIFGLLTGLFDIFIAVSVWIYYKKRRHLFVN